VSSYYKNTESEPKAHFLNEKEMCNGQLQVIHNNVSRWNFLLFYHFAI